MSHDVSALRKFVLPETGFGAGSRRSVANFASNLEPRLAQLGVATSDIPCLSGYALKDPRILTNPRKSCLRDVQVVYEQAL